MNGKAILIVGEKSHIQDIQALALALRLEEGQQIHIIETEPAFQVEEILKVPNLLATDKEFKLLCPSKPREKKNWERKYFWEK